MTRGGDPGDHLGAVGPRRSIDARTPSRLRHHMELADSATSAREAGLQYVSDAQPGISRHRCGAGFRYRLPNGRWLPAGSPHVRRIGSLVIPPAWERVWICTDPLGHLQATGFDARGRKQYRYHERWHQARTRTRFELMPLFGRALPEIRRRVEEDLRGPGLSRDKVLACVVRLLDQTLIRVGNAEYAETNDSYGLTTIRRRHVQVDGTTIRFRFRGKSGRLHEVDVEDPRAAAVVRRCQELPSQELFQFTDDDGQVIDITSTHVNAYLGSFDGGFMAKDFRTWGGSITAALAFESMPGLVADAGLAERKRCEVAAVRAAAASLRNTVATCRKFYVHPEIAVAAADGRLARAFVAARRRRSPRGLRVAERALLRLLDQFDPAKVT